MKLSEHLDTVHQFVLEELENRESSGMPEYIQAAEVAERSVTEARETSDTLLAALKALRLSCLADVLNPCWDNRPTDKPGLHWVSKPDNLVKACSWCVARAAIAKAEGQ